MVDFSINFANDVLTPADFSYRKIFGHAGFVLENTFTFKHFENFIPKLSLSIKKGRMYPLFSGLSATNERVSRRKGLFSSVILGTVDPPLLRN